MAAERPQRPAESLPEGSGVITAFPLPDPEEEHPFLVLSERDAAVRGGDVADLRDIGPRLRKEALCLLRESEEGGKELIRRVPPLPGLTP